MNGKPFRDNKRMSMLGLDLSHPIDRMPDGAYPFMSNVRTIVEGRIEARPGLSTYATSQSAVLLNSLRRLNDPGLIYSGGSTYIAGNNDKLQAGYPELGTIDSGYSGDPLSLIPFRPDNSPAAWMYVYDRAKQVKVRPDNTIRAIGATPPNQAPQATYGQPSWAIINDPVVGQGWVANGNTASPGTNDRTGGLAPTVGGVLYDSGTTGWCCLAPSASSFDWAGERMMVVVGGEQITIREIHPIINATSISAIQYDSGTTGECTIVLSTNTTGVTRNTLIVLNTETVKVQTTIPTADGTGYCIRCKTTINHAAGEAVTGTYSWYVYTTVTHSAGETIVTDYENSAAAANSGTVNTSGTAITWVSGQKFNTAWPTGSAPGAAGATQIKIAAQVWTIASISDSTHLVVNAVIVGGVSTDPGTQSGAAYSVTTASLSGSVDLFLGATGNVSTSGTTVTWVSGTKFTDWPTNTKIVINSVTYKVAFTISPTSLALTTSSGTQTNVAYTVAGVDASTTNLGRAISFADDYVHFSIFLQYPQNVGSIIIGIDIDPATTGVGSGGNAFQGNYWTWTIQGSTLVPDSDVALNNVWVEVVVPISSGTRSGNNLTLGFNTIKALRVQVLTTTATNFGWDGWYFFGTYGPTIQPNNPTGYRYEYRYRDATTGTASLPGPFTDYDLFPLREQVLISTTYTNAAGIDSIDLYRLGGVLTNFGFVGTIVNNNPTAVFSDTLADNVVAENPQPDLTLIQPWPIQVTPWSGLVNVTGDKVVLLSGSLFDVNLIAGAIITINGVAYQVRGNPIDISNLNLLTSGGVQTNVPYQISAPILANQPLPFVFGPLEGPFAPVVFGLGDLFNPGTLYPSNFSNADAASDSNTIEVTNPSEPLVSGSVWNGIGIVGSHDNLYQIRYSYNAASPWQKTQIPSASGVWSRWAMVRGQDAVYFLGRDGIYRCTDQESECITDKSGLYPLFPHEGQAAVATNGLNPIDMTQLNHLRLVAGDGDILFHYYDTLGVRMVLRYEISFKRWFSYKYAVAIEFAYLVEESETTPNTQTLLMAGSSNGNIYSSSGDTDNGADIVSVLQTPCQDLGDQRAEKLYIDFMHDTDQKGRVDALFLFDDLASSVDTQFTSPVARGLSIVTISEITNLALYRNIAVRYTWTGGPSGPRLYAYESNGYIQPILSFHHVTQSSDLGFAGWKYHRRLYAGLISTSTTTLTILCQDGRSFRVNLPSTSGRMQVSTLMLPQCIKDLAFAYQLDGAFYLFRDMFTIEVKGWNQPEFVKLPIFSDGG